MMFNNFYSKKLLVQFIFLLENKNTLIFYIDFFLFQATKTKGRTYEQGVLNFSSNRYNMGIHANTRPHKINAHDRQYKWYRFVFTECEV